MNVILKFQRNKTGDGVLAFYKKKVHFVLKDSPVFPKHGENWECFIWLDRPKYNLVKPFKKIAEKDLTAERARVKKFNDELKVLQDMRNEDMAKIVYDDIDNTPYLLCKDKDVISKYPNMEFKVKGEQIWARVPDLES